MTMQTQQGAPAAGTKLSQADFDALLMKSAEAGARQVLASFEAKTKVDEEAKRAAKPAPPEAKQRQAASQEQIGALTDVTRTLDGIGGLDIPFGSVVIGAIPGVVVGELIDGLVSKRTATDAVNWLNPALKIGAAAVGARFLRGTLGSTGTMFYAGTLALQIMAQVLPLDKIVAQIVGAFRKVAPKATSQPTAAAAQAYLNQAFNPRSAQGGMWA